MLVTENVPAFVKCRRVCKSNLSALRCFKFRKNMKEVSNDELFAPGHRGCAGCGCTVAMRLALKVAGDNTVATHATGCMEVISSPYPETAWRIPWIHVAFENSAAVASGVEAALKALGKKDKVNVIAFGGDGGTVDIGLQALSGAMERGHDMLYICYDNEAYMNTGVQRSGATPYGASTTTSPPGSQSIGNDRPKKDMPQIIAAHNVPYVATASIAFPLDYMAKVEKALQVKGPSYIHIHASCTPGWGIPSDKGIEIPRLAVDSGMWVLYEIVNGDTRVTYKPAKKQSVKSYLKMQKRFKHLDEPAIEQIQAEIDKNWDKIFGGKS